MKKSLGQHFLRSTSVARAVVRAADVGTDDTVLEIGPGKGMLTDILLEKAGRVIAVEKDDELVHMLKEKYAQEVSVGKLEIRHEDILNLDLKIFSQKPYKVVANIPYNITGAIIRRFLEAKHQPKSMTLMVQKEVADRIVARDGKESLLSISVKVYGTPRMIQKVPARLFSPAPRVDSAIIHISDISRSFFESNNLSESDFFTLIRTGFAHKRKKLANNLATLTEKARAQDTLMQCNLTSARAEELSLSDWVCVTACL